MQDAESRLTAVEALHMLQDVIRHLPPAAGTGAVEQAEMIRRIMEKIDDLHSFTIPSYML